MTHIFLEPTLLEIKLGDYVLIVISLRILAACINNGGIVLDLKTWLSQNHLSFETSKGASWVRRNLRVPVIRLSTENYILDESLADQALEAYKSRQLIAYETRRDIMIAQNKRRVSRAGDRSQNLSPKSIDGNE